MAILFSMFPVIPLRFLDICPSSALAIRYNYIARKIFLHEHSPVFDRKADKQVFKVQKQRTAELSLTVTQSSAS